MSTKTSNLTEIDSGPHRAIEPTPPATPRKYATINVWCEMTGMSRTGTYEAIGRGDLQAVKLGDRTLIDVERGLAWMASLPPARIAAPKSAA